MPRATRVASPNPEAPSNKAQHWHRSVWRVRGRRRPNPPSSKAQDRATPEEPRGPAGKGDLHATAVRQLCKTVTRTKMDHYHDSCVVTADFSLDGFDHTKKLVL